MIHHQSSEGQTKIAGAIGTVLLLVVVEVVDCWWWLVPRCELLVLFETTGENWRHTIVPRKSSESSESLYCKTNRSLLVLEATTANAGGGGGDSCPTLLCSVGGVTSRSILPFSGILMLPLGPVRLPPKNNADDSMEGLTSSTLDVLRCISPWRSELERLKRISSTRSECDRPLFAPRTDGDVGTPNDMSGLSGNERELAFWGGPNDLTPVQVALLLRRLSKSQMLMCERRRLLWRSNVLWAENGLGRIKYLKYRKKNWSKSCCTSY